MDKKFLCVCGHEKEVHYLGKKKSKACWYCPLVSEWCDGFVGDNLKYLENKI